MASKPSAASPTTNETRPATRASAAASRSCPFAASCPADATPAMPTSASSAGRNEPCCPTAPMQNSHDGKAGAGRADSRDAHGPPEPRPRRRPRGCPAPHRRPATRSPRETPTSGTAPAELPTTAAPATPPRYHRTGRRRAMSLPPTPPGSRRSCDEHREHERAYGEGHDSRHNCAGVLAEVAVDPCLRGEQRPDRDGRCKRKDVGARPLVSHSTILEIGSSRMSRPPAARSAGMSSLTPRFGTTLATA